MLGGGRCFRVLDDKAAGFLLERILLLRGEARHEHVGLLVSLAKAYQFFADLADFLAVDGRLLAQLFDEFSLRC